MCVTGPEYVITDTNGRKQKNKIGRRRMANNSRKSSVVVNVEGVTLIDAKKGPENQFG